LWSMLNLHKEVGKGGTEMGFRLYALFLLVTVFSLLSVNSVKPWDEWHLLEIKIRDNAIKPEEARNQMVSVHSRLMSFCTNHKQFKSKNAPGFVFPVEAHTHEDIGGLNGSGYYGAKYFRFYDNTRRASHTAHDIFVYDNNFDGKCDLLQDFVNVLSTSDGIVVSINTGWVPAQTNLRGGNYVWVLDPHKQEYLYYAHLHDVSVAIGQIVTAGQKLGTIGRSGLNAYKKKSITHLHYACIQFDGGNMTPRNPYPELLETGRVNAKLKRKANKKLSQSDLKNPP